MKLRILGCSGGIGGRHLQTTAMLVDDDILIDCGTGVAELSLAEMAKINHIFLTHSHLDHIACLPLLVDSVIGIRQTPIVVHAIDATIDALRVHIFNWTIWPDFTKIPSETAPSMRFQALRVDERVEIGGRGFVAIPAHHTVPAIGYQLDSGRGSLVFTGDTSACPERWERVNKIANLKYLLIETAFPNDDWRLAMTSRHLCPVSLAEDLMGLTRDAEIFITHTKPESSEETMQEVRTAISKHEPRLLQHGQVLEF
jgi:ribonuclease BN (tRNA processing enzyme)